MIGFIRLPVLLLCLVILLSGSARADFDDRPGFDFHPQSTASAPCGAGTPPRGHFSTETAPAARLRPVVLTIRQDADRLCYVSDTIAEPPVFRLRQGAGFAITLRNEITDPTALDRVMPAGLLDSENPPVPSLSGFVPVEPGTAHHATGASNLHFHGFSVPPVPPEDEVMATCVDPAVGPAVCGRRDFTYRIQIPRDMPAGLYWYHPHVHGEVQAQMLMGLSGAIVVEGPEDDQRRAAGIADKIFIVRQARDLDAPKAAGATEPEQAAEQKTGDASPAAADHDRIDTRHELACQPNTGTDEITLNGAKVVDGEAPDGDLAPVVMSEGGRQYWRFLNAATDSYLNLALVDEAGVALPITVAERDGAPLTDDAGHRLTPLPSTAAQLVPPAGRIEFYVTAPPPGHHAYLVSHEVDTGCTGDKVPSRRLILLTTAANPAAPPTPAIPVAADAPDRFTGLLAAPTDRTRTIILAEYPRAGRADQTDFYIAERRPGMVLRPFAMGEPPQITVDAGAVEEWVVENWTNETHAFHIHQLHFRVLESDGRSLAEPPLLDTVNVPHAHAADVTQADGAVVPGRVRVKLAFPAELAGDIPFHCHLVDHEDAGMMGIVRVVADSSRKADLTAPVGGKVPICGPTGARVADSAGSAATNR
jgi:FtsP/CotA-like multicopper oxidase with cupredoxin domain